MSKEIKNTVEDENQACEIIELAVEEIELLTRAFTMITDVIESCSQQNTIVEDPSEEKSLLH
jgi:hypothetical protein